MYRIVDFARIKTKREKAMHKKAIFYIILAGILWGTSGLFVNSMVPMGLTVIQITAIRAIVSAVGMSGYALICDRSLFKIDKKDIPLYFFSGLAIFSTSACYFLSMSASSVSTAVVLMYTAPVLVMLYSVTFLGERFTSIKFISLVLVTLGSCLVSGIIGGFTYSARGILFGFGAGISYSTYNVLTKIEMRRKSSPVSASMYSFIFMAVVAVIFSKPIEIIGVAAENPASIIVMLLCGLCTCIIPYFLYTLSLKSLPVGTASSLGIVEPMSATLFSIALLGERLNLFSFCGIIFILIAVFLLSNIPEE